jgi:hypothetical protein
MTDFKAASTMIEVTPVETAVSNPLHVILARKIWLEHPTVRVSYDSSEDILVLRMVELPSAYSKSSQGPVFVGFDMLGEGAWPTTIAVSSASRTFFGNSPDATVVRQLAGERVREVVRSLLTAGDSQNSIVELASHQARELSMQWNDVMTVLQVITAEEMTDEILESVLLSWVVELAPAVLRDDVALETIDSEGLPEAIRRSAAVADEELFQLLVGRKHRTAEPWPVARLDLDRKGEDYLVSVVVPLPQEPPAGIAISADVTINGQSWSISLEKDQAQDRVLSRKLVGCRLIPYGALLAHKKLSANQTVLRLQIKATPAEQA